MKQNVKRLVSFLVAAIFVISLMPVIGMAAPAASPATILAEAVAGTTSTGSQTINDSSLGKINLNSSGARGWAVFDLSDYQAILDSDVTITMTVFCGDTSVSANQAGDFKVYGISDAVELDDITGLTGTSASAMINDSNKKVIADFASITAEQEYTKSVDVTNLKDILRSGKDSKIILMFERSAANKRIHLGKSDGTRRPKIEITYTADDRMDQNYIDKLASELTLADVLNGQDSGNVTESLLNSVHGATVTYTANEVVAADGTITLSSQGDKTVEVKATVTYQGVSSDEITLGNITVVGAADRTEKVEITMTNPDWLNPTLANYTSGAFRDSLNATVASGDALRYITGEFDFTGLKDENDNALNIRELLARESTEVKIKYYYPKDSVSAFNQYKDAFNIEAIADEIEINDADGYPNVKKFALNKAGNLAKIAEVPAVEEEGFNISRETAINKANLIAALNDGMDNELVTFLFSGTQPRNTLIAVTGTNTPVLTITYKPSEENADYITTAAAALTWDDISAWDANAITADITLPAKLLGVPVTWSSDNTAAITAEGAVNPAAATKTAKLTAEFENGTTKDFNLTVAPESIKLYNITGNPAADICTTKNADCTAYLAVYAIEEGVKTLVSINTATVAADRSVIGLESGAALPDGGEYKLFIWNGLTPVAVIAGH